MKVFDFASFNWVWGSNEGSNIHWLSSFAISLINPPSLVWSYHLTWLWISSLILFFVLVIDTVVIKDQDCYFIFTWCFGQSFFVFVDNQTIDYCPNACNMLSQLFQPNFAIFSLLEWWLVACSFYFVKGLIS